MEYLFIWAAIAILTAIAANAKNRSVVAGFLVGAIFPVFGLVGYLIVKSLPTKAGSIPRGLLVNIHGERECPHCAELIKMQADKCRHCLARVVPITEEAAKAARKSVYEPLERKRTLIVLALLLAVAGASFLFR